MAAKQKGLGRGIDAILDDNLVNTKNAVTTLRLSVIEPRTDQPRKAFAAEALAQLADSIAAHGVLQPILVRESEPDSGYYQIIAGERRWRAAKMAGLTELPVIVLESDELEAAQIALIENVQRTDLNPVEEAFGYRHLIDSFALTQEQISAQVGKSRSAIANSLRLLDLPEESLELLRTGELSAGHARALLGLRNRNEIDPLARKIIERGLSVRAVEDAVRLINLRPEEDENAYEGEENGNGGASPEDIVIDYFAELERKSMQLLGRKVKIAHTKKKKTLELAYEDNADLEELLKLLCGAGIFEDLPNE